MACHRWVFIAFVAVEILCGRAFATVNFVSASGYSNAITTSTNIAAPSPAPSASPVSGTTAFPNFYYSNISTNQNTAAVGCAGQTSMPCYVDNSGSGCSTALNPSCHNASDVFSITVSDTAAVTGTGEMYIVYAATTPTGPISTFSSTGSLSSPQPYGQGGSVTFTSTWGNICSVINTVNGTFGLDAGTCHDNASPPGVKTASIYVIADPTNSGDVGSELAAFTIYFISSIPANSSVAATLGLYGFSMFPGDQKAYVQDISTDGNFNTTTENGVGVGNVVVYYTAVALQGGSYNPQTQYNANDFTNLGPTTLAGNAVGTANIGVNQDGSLQSNEVTNLNDGMMYYFHVALQDNALNIGYLTQLTDDTVAHTAIPDEVVGLLSQDHCFIATAAFGSPLARQVKILRAFRDKFLLPSRWGKNFVHWYYRTSPPWAALISRHDSWRAVARAFLYPLVAYSFVALKIGAFNATLALVTLLMLPLLFLRWRFTARPWKADP